MSQTPSEIYDKLYADSLIYGFGILKFHDGLLHNVDPKDWNEFANELKWNVENRINLEKEIK